MNTKPVNRRHEKTKEKILDTAIKIIIKEGTEKLTLRYLANKIDYSHAALYKFFKNKDELLEEIRSEVFIKLAGYTLKDVTPEMKINEYLMSTGTNIIEFALKYPELYMIIFDPKIKASGIEEGLSNPLFGVILERIEESYRTGDLKLPENSTTIAFAFQNMIMLHGIIMIKLTFLRDPSSGFLDLGRNILKSFYNSSI